MTAQFCDTPQRPTALRPGDTVAVLSPAWGGPSVHPHVFDAGLSVLTQELGLTTREYPTTRAAPELLSRDPAARASDLTAALRDPEVRAIFTSIGGDDSIRILPYLDPADFINDPKVVVGYAGITTLLLFARGAGLVTFHGPTVMSGWAQAKSLPTQALGAWRSVLFDADAIEFTAFPWWVDDYPDWHQGPATAEFVGTKYTNLEGPIVLRGSGSVEAELLGGCLDVMGWMLGTDYFPPAQAFHGKLLLLETSDEKPSIRAIRRLLWNFSVQGLLDGLVGLVVGRAHGYRPYEAVRLGEMLLDVTASCGRSDLPIIMDVDIGHTAPQHIVPLGTTVVLDLDAARLRMKHPAVARPSP